MADKSDQERQRLFRKELRKLNKGNYIDDHTYEHVQGAYDQFTQDTFMAENEGQIAEDTNTEQVEAQSIMQVEEGAHEPAPQPKAKPKKQKKVKTAEQIRERNITWLLTLGVLLLLIVGLVLATSNWDQMGPSLKVFSIAFVSLFFLGLSWLLEKVLHIQKTAFAFLTLGSLFVPIAVLSIGFFGLLGDYLSLTGDGVELLGLMGALLPLPLYIRNATHHDSRLFIWLSYLFSTFAVGFGLAALELSIDVFYLGIMVYNAVLLFLYHRYRHRESFRLFTKELPAYAQLNLIVSTLLMLLFFENEYLYSFNILLTAGIYMSMVFVYNTKHYQFVFNALLAYGAYQLIEETSLIGNADLLLYALVAFIYLALTRIAENDPFMRNVFQYTSAFISFLAFIYISFQGILVRSDEASPILFLAYVVISLNYGYLAYVTKARLFAYLSPIFLMVAGMQSYQIVSEYLYQPHISLYMYGVGVLLFLGLYVFNKHRYLQPVKSSSFVVSMVTIGLAILFELVVGQRNQDITILFLATAGVAYVVWKTAEHPTVQKAALAVHPASIGIALIAVYTEIKQLVATYDVEIVLHTAFTSIILLGISSIWNRVDKGFGNSTFVTAQVFYTFSLLMVLSFDVPVNEEFGRPFVCLLGIAFYTLLVKKYQLQWLWSFVALMTLGFYASLYVTFGIEEVNHNILFWFLAPFLLLMVAEGAGRKVHGLRPYFYWLAHLIQPVVIAWGILMFMVVEDVSTLPFFIPIGIYIYSTWKAVYEAERHAFLYASFSMIPLILYLAAVQYELLDVVQKGYVFVVTSLLMLGCWMISNAAWRTRIDWYFIFFNVVGLYIFVLDAPQTIQLYELGVIIPYTILVLWSFHRKGWTIANIVPLALSFYMWGVIGETKPDFWMILVSFGLFVILGVVGFIIHKWIFEQEKPLPRFDWYSVTAILYLAFSYVWISWEDSIVLRITPLVLFSLFLWIQHRRFQGMTGQKVLKTLSAVSILAPYYLLFEEYQDEIHQLIEAEILALPWLVLAIGFSLRTWKHHKKIMQHVQTVVLVLVTSYLTIDAIQSNTIWDALIMGILSLISVIVGMQLRIKSYFFVGIGVLLLNVFLQSKPYWGNMPWWAYLLIAGTTLIVVASYNEWQKQKGEREGKPLVQTKVKQILNRLKEWD